MRTSRRRFAGLTHWVRSSPERCAPASKVVRKTRQARPRLELLEDRLAPSMPPMTTGIAALTVPQNAPPAMVQLFNDFTDPVDGPLDLTYAVVNNSNPAFF